MLKKEMIDQLNEQLNLEFYSANLYLQMRIAVLLLLTTTVIPGTVGRPQKDPRGNDIIDDRADFGTPEHDNRVHTELTELVSQQVRSTELSRS